MNPNPKPKKLAYELIRRDGPAGRLLYPLLDDLVEQYHEDLRTDWFWTHAVALLSRWQHRGEVGRSPGAAPRGAGAEGKINMRLVLVEWLDSYGCSAAWQDINENVVTAPLMCRSVGWLLREAGDCKVIVPHLSDPNHPGANQQGCGDMTIPSRAVLRIVDLQPLDNSAQAFRDTKVEGREEGPSRCQNES